MKLISACLECIDTPGIKEDAILFAVQTVGVGHSLGGAYIAQLAMYQYEYYLA